MLRYFKNELLQDYSKHENLIKLWLLIVSSDPSLNYLIVI